MDCKPPLRRSRYFDMNLKNILAEIYPLHRTLSSEGTDKALSIIGKHVPVQIEEYPALSKAWTWTIPERYIVHEAYIELDGECIVDFKDNSLHLVSYSQPIDKVIGWDELEPHLHYSVSRPDAIPWMYKYYERDWGFCLSKSQFDTLPRDGQYHVVIRSEFDAAQGLRVGTAFIDNGAQEEMLIASHICHPNQANDDASGVVTALELINRLVESPLPKGSMNIRFLFCPETIGAIAYLANRDYSNVKGGMFLEMTGNDNLLAWHRTRAGCTVLDRISENVIVTTKRINHREREFASTPANDERVIDGPGVNIPCISLNRWPYPEYHTSDDNLDIICEDELQGAADVAEQIIRIFASNYYPKRTFTGPLFMSGNGLWVDWRTDWDLNRAIEKITYLLDGELSVFDIAQEVGLDYWTVREWLEKLRAKGLINGKSS